MQVYIDESGDHNLKRSTLDNFYNVFVLAGVCFKDDIAYKQFDQNLRELKNKLFDSAEYHLHTAEINRPSKASDPLTHKFLDPKFRSKFYQEMNLLIDQSSVKIITAVVRKD